MADSYCPIICYLLSPRKRYETGQYLSVSKIIETTKWIFIKIKTKDRTQF